MGTYKGNSGHLMQHWTLCELLVIAGKHSSGLSFIDAHAMAPMAHTPTRLDARFKRVRAGLPGQQSSYEVAWQEIVPQGQGYPNSAAFVVNIWQGDFSLLLCEIHPVTSNAIDLWREDICQLPMCANVELFQGDWRVRFAQGLPRPAEVGLPDESLTLVSFDPNMYNRREGVATKNPGNIYPEYLKLALGAMCNLEGGILIQLSTYDMNDNNPQELVLESVDAIMAKKDFSRSAVVRVNGHKMSLVYARNVPWAAALVNLPDRFLKWLNGC